MRDPYMSGLAPLHACFEQLGLIDYYTAVIESTLKGGARPEAMIGPKDPKQPWTPKERARIDSSVNSNFAQGNSGRIWTVDGSFDFHQLSYPPTDLAGLSISKDARLLAANCFDVPISMLEDESSNKATAQEGEAKHERNAVSPRCATVGAVYTHQLARPIDRRLFFAHDDAVQKDRQSNADIHDTYIDGGVLSPDEVRAELGREPRADGKGGEYRDKKRKKKSDPKRPEPEEEIK
jgi:phage portal protein BeeE